MQIDRLFQIVYPLLDRKAMTAKELAVYFEVSVRTILRDIDTLSSANIPVYTTQGKGCGISILDGYVLNKTALSEAERNFKHRFQCGRQVVDDLRDQRGDFGGRKTPDSDPQKNEKEGVAMENIITVTAENIDREHICCAISDKKGETCVSSKRAWMRERFADGLVFRKLDVRGKVFIEYLPAEKAWCPIDALGYMHINCFWVSGQYKGKGYANRLLEACIEDAKTKGCCGITALASEKKRPFLSDPDYLKHKGFQVADTAEPFFILYYLPFDGDAPVPKFKDCAKTGKIEEKGMVLFYTNQCPHTDKYVPLIVSLAKDRGAEISVHKLETGEQAQSAPTPFTTYGFFYDGVFLTNEILGPAKLKKFMDQKGF